MSKYPPASTKEQWFQSGKYAGASMRPKKVVIHTTEGLIWDAYQGGAIAPNYTAKPNIPKKSFSWRQHFPDERSSRALVNAEGGVDTNTLGAVQVELIGTCNPEHAKHWGTFKAGVDYIYWPDAPDWCLRAVADFIRYEHERHGIKLVAPTFKPYPDSYGASNGVRFTFRQWENFEGICGHQHVPENLHGDPGALPIHRILKTVAEMMQAKSKYLPSGEQAAQNIEKGKPIAKVSGSKVRDLMVKAVQALRKGKIK